ncbi:unnamed protein product [Caenorhabditis brenneri]
MKRLIIVLIVLLGSPGVLAETDTPENPVVTVEATTIPEPDPTEPELKATPEPKPTEPEPTEPEPETTLQQDPSTPDQSLHLETTAEPVEHFSTFEATTPSPTQRPEALGYPTDASDQGDEEGKEKEEEEQTEEGVTERKKYLENEEVDTDDYNFTDDSVASSTDSVSYVLAVLCLIF